MACLQKLAVGFTLDDADVFNSPEWKVWEERGRMNSAIGYNKDPARFASACGAGSAPSTIRQPSSVHC
jgi:hypothetical protein